MKNEKIIDVKEFIVYFLLKWRIAIVWMVFFAFLINSFSCFQSYKNRKNVENQLQALEQNNTQLVTSSYDQYTNGMSKMDIEKTEDAVDNYFMLKDSYSNLKKYCDKSIKMQIDPESVAVNELNFVLKETTDFENIYAEIKNDIINDEVSQNIINELGWNTEYSYIPELITIPSFSNEEDKIDNCKLSFKIIGPDKESVEKIGEIIKDRIEKKKNEYEKNFGNSVVGYSGSTSYIQSDSQLLLFQQTYKEKKNGVISLMNSLYNSLDGNQQTYFRALIENEEETLQNNSITSNTDQDKEIVLPEIQYFNIKYMILGAVVGFLIFIIINVIIYAMDGRLQTAKSIRDCFEVAVLGVVNDYQDKNKKASWGKKIDYMIQSIFMTKQEKLDYQNLLQIICAEIQVSVNRNKFSHIYITGNVKDDFVNQFICSLTQNLNDKNIQTDSGLSVSTDADSLLKLSDCDGIVLVEELMKTNRKDIEKEIEVCKRHEVGILGAVVISSK